jgi:hypothetical protein
MELRLELNSPTKAELPRKKIRNQFRESSFFVGGTYLLRVIGSVVVIGFGVFKTPIGVQCL